MARLTNTLTDYLTDTLGEIPTNLTTAISSLTTAQRDNFIPAWINATPTQQTQPATQWAIQEDDRDAFTRFQTAMLTTTTDPT